ncbi:uncharacterized protein LOC133035935 [Cannabis sativa]|uniref:uncharacterized protein LOC133035935 n=1 Tax=Cannabis sativa TaxID=3483 RepID=UPI0029CA04FE|nr:uncharacterized protein LOC133035935 [Cannabis sativa]
MRCLSWNYRGLRRPTTERSLRGLIRENDADFLFLSKTKVSTEFMVQLLNRLGFVNSCCIPAEGTAGGFCVAWRVVVQVDILEVYDMGFKVKIEASLDYPQWVLFCINGPAYAVLKKNFWDWLIQIVQQCKDAWAIMGDLNVIMDENEKIRGRKYQLREGNILKNFMFNSGGVDLGFEGAPCTWQNARSFSHHIRKRLDRVIADDQWCVSFPRASVVHLPIYGSDHAPILLKAWGEYEKLLYPFRFLEVWTTSSECGNIISNAWQSVASGNEGTILCSKLKYTKKELKKWNAMRFGHCEKRLQHLKRDLGVIQEATVSQENLEKEATIQLEILNLEEKIERIWRQKSRECWLKFGDNNTKFFHASTLIRRRRNRISCIEASPGLWLKQRQQIGDYFLSNFKNLYQTTDPSLGDEFESLFRPGYYGGK